MRHLDANIAFWKRAAAELQTPAQLQSVKFPRDLPLRFLQLAEATGKDGASAVDQMPPLDELTRQLEVQMLEKGQQQHFMDDFNAEIASAVVHHHDHSKVKDLSRDSGGDESRSGNIAENDENTKGSSHLSQPSPSGQSTDHEQASARGAAFLFQWGGLFARYTPPQRNFLALDLGLRKVLYHIHCYLFRLSIYRVSPLLMLFILSFFLSYVRCALTTFRRCSRSLTRAEWCQRGSGNYGMPGVAGLVGVGLLGTSLSLCAPQSSRSRRRTCVVRCHCCPRLGNE